MIAAGSLDRRIQLLRYEGETTNDLGEPVEGWTPAEKLWASKTDVSDVERVRAQAVGTNLTTRFVVRSSSVTRAIAAKDRIACEGRVYDVTGLKEIGRRDGIEITAASNDQAAP